MKQIWEECNRNPCHISSGTPTKCLFGSEKTFWDFPINHLIQVFMTSWKSSLFLNCLVYLLDLSIAQRSIFLLHTLHSLATKGYSLSARHWMWPAAHASIILQYHLYRGADKSLARPGRKQAQKHVGDACDFNNIETWAVTKYPPPPPHTKDRGEKNTPFNKKMFFF